MATDSTGKSVTDYVGQALSGFIDVAKIKAAARLNATPALQSAGINSVSKPSNNQAVTADGGGIAGHHWVMWAAGGLALVVLAVVASRG